MAAVHASPFTSPFPAPTVSGDEERFYLTPPILAAVRREASVAGIGDWNIYAQNKLDRELHACSLVLTDEQVAMLHRYAEVLGTRPHDLLAALLAPEAARQERWRRDTTAFLRRHRPHWPIGGCLATMTMCLMILFALWVALHIGAALSVVPAHP